MASSKKSVPVIDGLEPAHGMDAEAAPRGGEPDDCKPEQAPQERLKALVGQLGHADNKISTDAADAEVARGLSAVPDLIEVLKSNNVYARRNAAWCLGEIKAPVAIPALVEALQDSDRTVCGYAGWALGIMGVSESRVIAALMRALGLADAEAPVDTSWALGMMGVSEPGATKTLMQNLSDKDTRIRGRAALALGLMRIPDPAVTTALAPALGDEQVGVHLAAAWALGRMGVSESGVIAALVHALDTGDAEARVEAAWVLGEFGVQMVMYRPMVTETLMHAMKDDKDARVRKHAAHYLGNINGTDDAQAARIFEGLFRASSDQSAAVRAAASSSLTKKPTAGPALLNIAGDSRRPASDRLRALKLFAGLDCFHPQLIQLLKTDHLRKRAMRLVVKAGLPAIKPLVAALEFEDRQTVKYAAKALDRLADRAELPGKELLTALKPAVPKLERLYRRFHKRAKLAHTFLGALLVLVEFFPEADTAAEKILEEGGEKAHSWTIQLRQRRKRRPYRLAQIDSELPSHQIEETINKLVTDLIPTLPAAAEDKAKTIIALERTVSQTLHAAFHGEAESLIKSLLEDIPGDYERKRQSATLINALLTALDRGIIIHDQQGRSHVCSMQATHARSTDETGNLRLRTRTAGGGSQKTFPLPSLDQLQIIESLCQERDGHGEMMRSTPTI